MQGDFSVATLGDKRSSSEPLCPVVRDVATIEDAISESGTYSYAAKGRNYYKNGIMIF